MYFSLHVRIIFKLHTMAQSIYFIARCSCDSILTMFFSYAKPRQLGQASRDFVALFILNPAAAPLVPARCALASSYMISRTLQPKNLTPENLQAWDLKGMGLFSSPHDPNELLVGRLLQVILSLAGFLPADDASKDLRNKMLLEQLKPTGAFVAYQNQFFQLASKQKIPGRNREWFPS